MGLGFQSPLFPGVATRASVSLSSRLCHSGPFSGFLRSHKEASLIFGYGAFMVRF